MKSILIIFYWLFNTGDDPIIPYKILTWDDFIVKSVKDNTASESVTSISYEYDGYSNVKVKCSFHKDESFVIKTAKTRYILNHEQRHFDITYIYAKKFTKLLNQQTEFTDKIVDDIYNKIIVEKDKMQEQYDFETNNSENKYIQEVWDKKIETMLNNLQWQ